MSQTRYKSASEMVNDISDDAELKKQLNERLRARQIVRSLVAMRAAKGVSQADIAAEIGCSQSNVSKIENGLDADLRLSDMSAYAKLLNLDFQFLVAERGTTLANQVKYHAFGVRDTLLELVKVAGTDHKIVEGIARFHVETFVNIVSMLAETSSQLPPCPDTGRPYIRIASCDDPMLPIEPDLGNRQLIACEANVV